MRRRNRTKHVLEECVERAHLADGLCRYEHHELVCMLASGAPQLYDLTKFAWDEFNLPRMMKDMYDELKGKFEEAGRDGSRLYIIGIQV